MMKLLVPTQMLAQLTETLMMWRMLVNFHQQILIVEYYLKFCCVTSFVQSSVNSLFHRQIDIQTFITQNEFWQLTQ